MIILKLVISIILIMCLFMTCLMGLSSVIPKVEDWMCSSKVVGIIMKILIVVFIVAVVIIFLGSIIGLFWIMWWN